MYSKYFLALAGQMVESNFPNSSGKGGKWEGGTYPNNPKSPPARQKNLVFLSADVPYTFCLSGCTVQRVGVVGSVYEWECITLHVGC